MQATSKEIYSQVALRTGTSAEEIKFVGDAFFKEWSRKLKSPSSIILKIKKLGRMYMRKNRLHREVEKIEKYISGQRTYKVKEEREEEMHLELEIYRERIEEYLSYVSKKKEIQAIRYPHQPLLSPIEDDEA